jgi:16S rRNA C967 or C1407 C5-methylase (RsmB/RsmF family)/NOL1/NOP2/fmu family ribosome biogenesis protein
MSGSSLIIPPAFIEQMRESLHTVYGDFIKSLTTKSPVSVRLNNHKKNLFPVLAEVPWCTTGKYLDERPVFTLDPTLHAGAYYVQEASSMLLEQAIRQSVDLAAPLKVLDLCAAPGGKSTHLLSLINKDSLLISNEVIRSRASILSENIQKWGNDNVVITNNDPEDLQRLKGFFDVIVVDAPCSGEGLFRKDPDAMKEWSPENVDLCSKRQRRILHDIWPALKQNGILIYSTCTYNSLENEDNLLWAKEQFDADFISLNIKPEWGIEEVKEKDIVGYHCYPHKVKGEGFFISVMRKTSDQDGANMKIRNKIFQTPPSKTTEQLNDWVINPDTKRFLQWKDNVLMVPKSVSTDIEFIVQNLHIVSTGTALCEIKHSKLIPDQALALSIDVNKEFFNRLQVTKEQALQYLRKETLNMDQTRKGFALITFENISLGWANVLDNRINNMYPANWRIRMAG